MNLEVEIYYIRCWVIVYLFSISEMINKNDMLFWNSKAKHPIEKIKVEEGKTKKENSVDETSV